MKNNEVAMKRNIPIYVSDGKNIDEYETHYIKDLLPLPFG